jgi:hypothetical protein
MVRVSCFRIGPLPLGIALSFLLANPAAGQMLTGRVLAGTTPIRRATVTLYGTVSYPCPRSVCSSMSEPADETATDAEGRFSFDLSKADASVERPVETMLKTTIPKVGRAPRPGSFYLVATGGDAGNGNNAATKLIAGLGKVPPEGHVIINEMTTVAAAFSLNGITIGSQPPSEYALALVCQLVDPVTGKLRPVFYRGANSPALINTLADIIHGCIISEGPGSQECDSLFAASPKWLDNKRPDNTLIAVEDIVANWGGHGKSAPIALPPKVRPYTPVLDHPPPGWLLSLNFEHLGLDHPTEVFADWTDHTLWILSRGNDSLVELSTDPDDLTAPLLGERELPAAVRNHPTGFWFRAFPIDYPRKDRPKPPGWFLQPSAWLADDKLILLKSDGTLCGAPFDGLGLKAAGGIWGCSIFGDGLCIANAGSNEIIGVQRPYFHQCDNSETKLLGTLNSATPGCGIFGKGVCIANAAADGDNSDTKLHGTLNRATSSTPHLGLAEPGHVITCTVTKAGNWVTNRANNSVSAFDSFDNWWPLNPKGGAIHAFHQVTVLPGSPTHGGGLADPEGVACDLKGNAWIANHARNANSVTELENYFDGRRTTILRTLSPDSGFSGAGMNRPYGIAVDGMGNVWVSNEGNDSLTVFIGAGQ